MRFVEERSSLQRRAVVAVVLAVVAWRLVRSGAAVVLDRWWLASVTDAPIWSRRTAAQLQLGFSAAAFVLLVLGGSVWIVLRVAARGHGPRHRFWQRYDQRVGPAHRWALVALVGYLTWHIGQAAAGQWQDWLLFRYGGDLGVRVPEIGGDLGFHLFRLPLLATASSFVRQLLLLTLVVSIIGHAASGALRMPRRERPSAPAATTHLALLTAFLLAAQAAHEVVVARAATATNRVGAFDGPGFAEIDVTRPVLLIAAITCVVLGATIVEASRSGRWRPAAVAAGAAAVVHVIGLVVLPPVVERLVVAPAEADRQLWSIEHNLVATRTAYDLDVDPTVLALHEGLTAEEVEHLADDGDDAIPLFGTSQLSAALQVLVGTPGTRISDVDLLPYADDGSTRPVYVAARSASRADLPERGWVQEHLVYTHGDGVVTVAADGVDPEGRPEVSAPVDPSTEHTPLYFGEGLDGWYTVVHTRRAEYDGIRYDGDGVAVDTAIRRLVLALATGEAQPVLTSEFGPDALLLYRRGLRERVGAIAPFLTLDSDPYPVVVDDRVVWVLDGYTTASTYPYAQFLPAGQPAATSLATTEQNYVSAAVKATVDARDGTVHLYRTDGDDPIIDAWDRIYPGLLEPADRLPSSVAAHLRFPADLFAVQTSVLGRYHVDDAESLFNGADRWSISPAAATTVGQADVGVAPSADALVGDGLAGTRPFGPGAPENPSSTRDSLVGLAIGSHGADPELRLLVADTLSLLSPQVAQSAIDADPALAQEITLLNANGSHVEFGPMTPLLSGDGVAWARSITVIGTSPGSVPRLYGVAAVSDGRVGIGATVLDALAATQSGRAGS